MEVFVSQAVKEKKIRVLIVDDSSVIRTLLTRFLESDPLIEVVATAPDPYVAREKLISLKPDVMTLDVEMPRMDGVTFLEKVMEFFPTRTVIISSLSTRGSETALRALEVGAVDIIAKPAIDVTRSMSELAGEIVSKVKCAAEAKISDLKMRNKLPPMSSIPINTSKSGSAMARTTHQVLAIASSTGGTEALKILLPKLSSDLPGTVIVQHMPPVFTKTYAEHLQRLCPFEVKEAEDGDRLTPGRVLIAPGNFHMELTRNGAYYYVRLHQQPPLHGVRPSADYLMRSVAQYAGKNAVGVVLTGMGKDGAEGLLAMKEAGSYNIAQDENTCVVYGMPKAAHDIGAVHRILPIDKISEEIMKYIRQRENSND